MRALSIALNAAEGRLQIVLADETDMLCAQEWSAPRRGTEILAPALERIFTSLRLPFSAIGRIACVRGPGGFTGIRLALATAAALARASGAALAGLDHMQALALEAGFFADAAFTEQGTARLWVLQHARRDLVYAQVFAPDGQEGGVPRPASGLELVGPGECLRRMREQLQSGMNILATGSALARHGEFLRLPAPARRAPERLWKVSPESLLRLARGAEYGLRDIEALYVQPCDASENLESIARRRGEDPALARARLESLLAAEPARQDAPRRHGQKR